MVLSIASVVSGPVVSDGNPEPRRWRDMAEQTGVYRLTIAGIQVVFRILLSYETKQSRSRVVWPQERSTAATKTKVINHLNTLRDLITVAGKL
jgi:hypothetical protein